MDPREFGTWLADPRAARWLAGDQSEKLADAYTSVGDRRVKPFRVPA
jgi:hypothetical protein